ncbi:hypothetical protein [Hymenobacter chitinivorans]|uniref:Uncharacterized protein n=1 Tax=Hymenobacter chitinivorans DSM 11115 TaxID=1121954 RepID=A0A2M9B570_9BACT|nr:hypothetical protein [Hymenobacter chitinivorans]PJJ53099.1 hypothetical protein CLV45_3757 [Hymenobacter chitinivorans DSM 11115]
MSAKPAPAAILTIGLGALLLAVALTGVTVGFDQLLASSIDIQLHNTYFVAPPYLLILGLFLPLLIGGVGSYLLARRYRSAALALLGLGTMFIGLCSWLLYTLSSPLVGTTVYPPLDPTVPLPVSPERTFDSMLLLVILLQFAAVLAVIGVSYKAGQRSARRV